MIIVIDDLRTFTFPALYFRTSEEALSWFRENEGKDVDIDELWLDHDLGPDDDIRRVVRYLEDSHLDPSLQGWRINRVYVHTANPVGASYIKRSLRMYSCYQVDAAHFLLKES